MCVLSNVYLYSTMCFYHPSIHLLSNLTQVRWNGKFYRKIPHPGGRDDNVGCLLSKSFFKFFESRKLWSPEHGELIEQILGMNAGFSFWSGYRERIREQLVIESEEAER